MAAISGPIDESAHIFRLGRDIDSRLYFPKQSYAVHEGAASVQEIRTTVATATSSSLGCVINLPSRDVVVSRSALRLSARLFFQFTAAGLAAVPIGTPIVVQGRDVSLCSYPINSLISSATVRLGDAPLSFPAATGQAGQLMRHLRDVKRDRAAEMTPSSKSFWALHSDAFGTMSNPLASAAEARHDMADVPNGAFAWTWCDGTGAALTGTNTYSSGGITVNYSDASGSMQILANAASAAATPLPLFGYVDLEERIVCPPLSSGPDNDWSSGFFGISSITFSAQLQSPSAANLVWSNQSSSGLVVANQALMTVPWSNAVFRTLCLTPPLTAPLPARSITPFVECEPYPSTAASIASSPAGASTTVTLSAQTLARIPSRIMIAAVPTVAWTTLTAPFLLPINSISLTFGGASNLLADQSMESLYLTARKNGLDASWEQFAGRCNSAGGALTLTAGAPLVLRPGVDFPLPPGRSNASGGSSFSIGATCQVRNYSGAAITVSVVMVALYDGYVVISRDGKGATVSVSLNEAEVITAETKGPFVGEEHASSWFGGGLGDMLSRAVGVGRSLFDAGKGIHDAVRAGAGAGAGAKGGRLVSGGGMRMAERLL